MLSRTKCAQLAAVAALTIMLGANASMTTASAQSGIQLAQADRKDMQQSRRGNMHAPANTARAQADRKDGKQTTHKSTTTRRVTTNRDHKTTTRKVIHKDRVVVHSRPSVSVGFAVLGPRVVYRAYGAGWCRGLHRGRHFDRRNGWHAGRHYGPFRC
jgi:hypothetical protein